LRHLLLLTTPPPPPNSPLFPYTTLFRSATPPVTRKAAGAEISKGFTRLFSHDGRIDAYFFRTGSPPPAAWACYSLRNSVAFREVPESRAGGWTAALMGF